MANFAIVWGDDSEDCSMAWFTTLEDAVITNECYALNPGKIISLVPTQDIQAIIATLDTPSQCRFCGSNDVEVRGSYGRFSVVCNICLACGPLHTIKQDAIEAWNDRSWEKCNDQPA